VEEIFVGESGGNPRLSGAVRPVSSAQALQAAHLCVDALHGCFEVHAAAYFLSNFFIGAGSVRVSDSNRLIFSATAKLIK
jgi:hypothetical protein